MSSAEASRAPKLRTGSVFGSLLRRERPNLEKTSTVKFVTHVDVQEYSQSEFNLDSSSNKQYQDERQKVYEIVEKHYTDELKGLKVYLQTELTDLRKKSAEFKYPFTIHPAASYFLHQYILCCTELVLRLEKKKISYRNFRDFAANLSCLYETMVGRARINEEYHSAAMLMSWTLWKLFETWDNIAMVFEDVHHKQTTDWIALGTRIRNVFEKMDKKPSIKVVKKPAPDLSALSTPYIIGSCNFGTLYFSQLGKVPLVIRATSSRRDYDGLRKTQMRVFAQSACQLRHPLIERYLATTVIDNKYIACSDALFAINISQLVQRVFPRHGCPLELTRVVVGQVGLALFYLHFNGYIHLDVQAVNVMVSSTCRVKLMGQESAKMCIGIHNIYRKREFFRRTARELMGKENLPDVHFCPPEILKDLPYGRAVDWWYLGALTFFMYYNKTPFQASDGSNIAGQILKGRLRMKKSSVKGFKHFKSFIHDTLNPRAKHRLCSKSYAHFLKHKFFRGIIWEVLEKSEAIIELFEIENHMEPCEEYCIPPRLELRSRSERRRDSGLSLSKSEHSSSNLTFATTAMLNSIKHFWREQSLDEILWEENEVQWLPLTEIREKDSPYKFRDYFKKTRVPRELEI